MCRPPPNEGASDTRGSLPCPVNLAVMRRTARTLQCGCSPRVTSFKGQRPCDAAEVRVAQRFKWRMVADTSKTLTNAHKEFIVKRLAAFYTPSVICQQLVAQFGIKCNENDILANDPTACVVSPELFMLFRAERERVMMDPHSDPYTDQKARLVVLSQMVDRYKNNNDPANARAVLKQIAEELGVVGGKAGTPAKADDKTVPFKEVTVKRTVVHPTSDPANG